MNLPVIKFPEMPATYDLTRRVPDHEILLVFINDEDAMSFADWLKSEGWTAFIQSVGTQ